MSFQSQERYLSRLSDAIVTAQRWLPRHRSFCWQKSRPFKSEFAGSIPVGVILMDRVVADADGETQPAR